MTQLESALENIETQLRRRGRREVDYIGLETCLRKLLLAHNDNAITTPENTVRLIDEAIAAYTGRGYSLNANKGGFNAV